MTDNVRFTTYISKKEKRALEQMARKEAVSVNYLVRCSVRLLLGKEVPEHILAQVIARNLNLLEGMRREEVG